MRLKKIAIIGPESTGKSVLTKQLAAHFHTLHVEEYARHYLETHGTDYSLADLWKIAQGQMKAEDAAINECKTYGKQLLFVDTEMYVIKVWSEFVFNACDNRVLQQIISREYDMFLLCNTDLPWTKDNLREYPDHETRRKLFYHYHDLLVNQQVPWAVVSGLGEKRLQHAIGALSQNLFIR